MNSVKEQITFTNQEMSYVSFKDCVKSCMEAARCTLMPGYFCTQNNSSVNMDGLKKIFDKAMSFVFFDDKIRHDKLNAFFDKFDIILANIISDIEAAYKGDPACTNYDEIILTYPGFRAISAYRFAHELYVLDVPILPRAICEYEHSHTGIDIHPGAVIGRHFFIDHGTGVVIGETCIIGDNVTIYQNVTLGAKSFPQEDDGTLVKGIKRHPNIGNNVTIYSGATILGDINIGDKCVIGGNVWITKSVPANSKVSQRS